MRFLLVKGAYGSYRDYSDELGVEPDSQRIFYSKMRQTPKIRDVRVRVDGKRERAFQGLRLSNENDENGQIKLDSVPSGSDGPSSCTRKSLEIKEKGQYIFPGQSGTSGPAKTSDGGLFPVCFCCHLPVSELSELTNIDGKPVYRRCKAGIEAQKRAPAEDKERPL